MLIRSVRKHQTPKPTKANISMTKIVSIELLPWEIYQISLPVRAREMVMTNTKTIREITTAAAQIIRARKPTSALKKGERGIGA